MCGASKALITELCQLRLITKRELINCIPLIRDGGDIKSSNKQLDNGPSGYTCCIVAE